jgi:predicted Zn-dependent protease
LVLAALACAAALAVSGCATGETATAELASESLGHKSAEEGPVAAARAITYTTSDDDVNALLSAFSVLETVRKADIQYKNAIQMAASDPAAAAHTLDDIIEDRPNDARYRESRAKLAVTQGDPATAKTHWAKMDDLMAAQGTADKGYWGAVLSQSLLMEGGMMESSGGFTGDFGATVDALRERQAEAFEALADIALGNLDTEAAEEYMRRAEAVRAQ